MINSIRMPIVILLLAGAGTVFDAQADVLADRMKFWESKAPVCSASGFTFPSSETHQSKPCGDGDMTLFNGMLCAAGDERGCQAVADAQANSGEWHRSPRLRVLGYNDQGDATFSPDMALGAQLYLITTRDRERGWNWLIWLNNTVPCFITSWLSDNCWLKGLPRFCAPHLGCTARPGDLATLAWTVDYLQKNAGMPTLPDGRLRGLLGTFSGLGSLNKQIDANVNKAGFSQHLVAVSVWVVRLAGHDDDRMRAAIQKLVQRNPNNPFFLYLRDGKTAAVRQKTLEQCPSEERPSQHPLVQWQWEREEAEKAGINSNYWDCIFMGKLLTR